MNKGQKCIYKPNLTRIRLQACDIVGSIAVYHQDGTSYFLFITRSCGQFYAPDNVPNRAMLFARVEIRILPIQAKEAKI